MTSTNPTGPIVAFWQVFPASGVARFDTVEEANAARDDLLKRCPEATIVIEAPRATPRNTAVNVHTGFPISLAQRTVSARRARNVHARSVHCRRAAMYVAVGDHSRRFGPERSTAMLRAAIACPHCGRGPADADGHACDYCRGYAHRR